MVARVKGVCAAESAGEDLGLKEDAFFRYACVPGPLS